MMGSKTLNRLISNLNHPDASKRRDAAEAISQADERAIYPLLKALYDEDLGVQEAAMRSLIAQGSELVAYMVIPLLRQEANIRNMALIILRDLGKISVPFLYSLLKDKDPDIRKFALDLLGEIREGIEVRYIIPLLKDQDANVRAAAVKTLGLIGAEKAVDPLINSLGDEEWVAFAVIEALGNIGDKRALNPLLDLAFGDSYTLRWISLDAIAKIGIKDPQLIPPFLQLMDSHPEIKPVITEVIFNFPVNALIPFKEKLIPPILDTLMEVEWDKKSVILNKLLILGDERAIEHILSLSSELDLLNPEDEERSNLIKEVLVKIGSYHKLISKIRNPKSQIPNPNLIYHVIYALGKLKCQEALPYIKDFLNSPERFLREASAEALGEIGNSRATPYLTKALRDEEGHVRRKAAEALGKTRDINGLEELRKLIRIEKYKDVREEVEKAISKISFEL